MTGGHVEAALPAIELIGSATFALGIGCAAVSIVICGRRT